MGPHLSAGISDDWTNSQPIWNKQSMLSGVICFKQVCTQRLSLCLPSSLVFGLLFLNNYQEGCNSGITLVPNAWRWKAGACGPSQATEDRGRKCKRKARKIMTDRNWIPLRGTFKPKISIVPAPNKWQMACLMSAETKQQNGTTVWRGESSGRELLVNYGCQD